MTLLPPSPGTGVLGMLGFWAGDADTGCSCCAGGLPSWEVGLCTHRPVLVMARPLQTSTVWTAGWPQARTQQCLGTVLTRTTCGNRSRVSVQPGAGGRSALRVCMTTVFVYLAPCQ